MRGPGIVALLLAAAGCGGDGSTVRGRDPGGDAGLPSPPATGPVASRSATHGRVPAPRADERDAMVRDQIESREVKDPLVLAAMRAVPRHEFVPEEYRHLAYTDGPLPIGYGQTISQPYIVAAMTEELRLRPGDRVLEIGAGSGYQAAVLAEITDHVSTVEIVEVLAASARERLARLGYRRVEVRSGDGWFGWPEAAPFDAIVVTAAAPQVPPPLVEQLAKGGRMVIPVGQAYAVQTLVLVTKDADGTVRSRSLCDVRFVPFTRAAGREAR